VILVFTSAFLIDGTGPEPIDGAAVGVEDDRIENVIPNGKVGPISGPVTTLDLKGATVMPALTDAHVHICAVTENITDQHRHHPPSYVAARAMKRAEECLVQGFTIDGCTLLHKAPLSKGADNPSEPRNHVLWSNVSPSPRPGTRSAPS
jgi:imidazolonepropionase-like amidohydrolase